MRTIRNIIDESCFILSIILRSLFTLSLLACTINAGYSQQLTQVVKGKVVDAETQITLPGANVVVVNSHPFMGGVSDADGNFKIANVPVGRYSIQVSFVGYEPTTVPEVLVSSGKEVVLTVSMKQASSQLDGVTVKAYSRKDKPLNTMASISARSFTVEETRRYAGGLDDPARMASAFAGVTVGNIQDNAIIIRGNSPKGVSWRLEGVEIPNPNHFAGGNVAGGGFVTIFSSQVLANSDFFTGAFPAEYGNSMAGVFDMKLRSGNNEKHENTFQVGLMGIDFASEGPLMKGSKASYLFNYRYSTTSILSKMKIIPADQVPKYQDLSFKVNLPTATAGTFAVWGVGAIDENSEPVDKDSTLWKADYDRTYYLWNLNIGAAGVSHKFSLGENCFFSTTLAATGTSDLFDQTRYDDNLIMRPNTKFDNRSGKVVLNSSVTYKSSPKLTLKGGVNLSRLFFSQKLSSTIDNKPETYATFIDQKGSSIYTEGFLQGRYSLTDKLTLNAGLNGCYFKLNKDYSIDPRVALKYEINSDQSISFGFGRHTQMEELKIYLIKKTVNGQETLPNKDLKLSHAQHFVLGYDWLLAENLRFKAETYYQRLYDIPGIPDSTYSLINFKQDWTFDEALKNNTQGRNVGIDLTLERFLNKGYYYLVTASFFDSKYKDAKGDWHNTRYNKGYAINLLGGREFFLKKNRVLGINGRINYIGGERHSPIWMEKTVQLRNVYLDESHPFEEQFPATYYVDLTVTYRINMTHHSSTWALQVKNLLASPIYDVDFYNMKTNRLESNNVTLVLPVLSYRIDF